MNTTNEEMKELHYIEYPFSFTAMDRFASTGTAADEYILKTNPAAEILSQRLIMAE